MDSARWQQIEAAFEQALDLETTERAAFLAEIGLTDPELRSELEELLSSAELPGILDREIDELTPSLADGAGDEIDRRSYARGQELGPWRIVDDLGSGGMGRVFVAERAGGEFEQRVALKILRWEVADSAHADRFRRERQILASLEHPGIARLIDGGVSAEGLPYLATELVDGKNIIEYCDARQLDVPARLEIFLKVCDAVEFAHRNLVVHRDLKASNILVDAEDRVKLLDFGIAKIVDETRGEDEQLTGTQLAPATISTAAPEQLSGGAITTATDVWALGVLLYELLCGERAFSSAEDNVVEIMQGIATVDPPAPSECAPGERRRLVRGDLDNIVLKALRKDPAERYGAAAALAEDLRRHRDGLPVLARKSSWSYHAGKFLHRHAAALALTGAAIVVVAGLVGFYTLRLADERDRATQEARKTEEITSFVLSMFNVNDPSIAQGEELTARQVLDIGSQRIEAELSGQPEIRAEMHGTVGKLYEALGVYDESDHHLKTATELHRAIYGPRSEELAESLARWGFVLGELDRMDQAEEVLRESADIRRALGIEDALASTLNQLGMMLGYRGEYEEAEALLRESVEMKTRLYGENGVEVATSMMNLGLTLKWKGDSDAAEPLYRKALEIREQQLGTEDPAYAATLDNLGVLLGQRGSYEESEICFREALEIRRRVLGEQHPDVALNLNNLATLFRVQGRLDDAEPIYREVLALNIAAYGPDHRHVATNLTNLGSVLVSREKFDEAVTMFGRVIEIRRKSLGDHHIDVAQAQGHMVSALMRQGRFAEAEPIAEAAVSSAREAVEGSHPTLAKLLQHHGDILVARGRPKEAEPILREALKTQEEVLDPEHWQIAASSSSLGRCLADLGQDDEAEQLLQSGYEGLLRERGPEDRDTIEGRDALHQFYTSRGRADEAAALAPADS